MFERYQGGERAVLVHVDFPDQTNQEDLTEFVDLTTSAGLEVLGIVTTSRSAPQSKYFVGSGKIEEIAELVAAEQADVVLFNHSLSPSQERNIEYLTKCRVVDRTGLILDIFAQRAQTHEGKLQVELAQLQHISTRLVRGWTHLERQKGGIGLRGPGETQLETDRRLLRERIKTIRKRLEKVERQREQGRRSRKRANVPTVSLVGYTNAGKSTLFNRLTESHVLAADQLFATLDPTHRRINVNQQQSVILADTVGFIRHLPHDLVAAFKATLQESREADILLHVIDAADERRDDNKHQVYLVLDEIGANDSPVIEVYNKSDKVEGLTPRVEQDPDSGGYRVYCSAVSGAGIDGLLTAIAKLLDAEWREETLQLAATEMALRGQLYDLKCVQSEHITEQGEFILVVRLTLADWKRLERKNGIDLEQRKISNELN
ncbi:MAG: GTPase HflX [Gammaproteobacteria bacterium]|nr:GTPase HflX [Gammaproteobacteria bacterium]NVK87966.1 GTPase HflX [Gammaproteobacteria bacterium]